MVTRPNISALRRNPNFISEGNVIRSRPVRFTRLRQGNNPEQIGSFSNLTFRVLSDGTIIQERRAIRLLRSGRTTLQQTADIKEFITFKPDGTGTREVFEFVPSRSGRSESRRLLEREVLTGVGAVQIELRTNLTPTQKQNIRFRQAKIAAGKRGQKLSRSQFNRQTRDIKTTTQKQRVAAAKKVGVIRAVTRRKDEVTFVGITGKKVTFPAKGLKFTARERPGGIPTLETRREREFRQRIKVLATKTGQKIAKQKGTPVTAKVVRDVKKILKKPAGTITSVKKQKFFTLKFPFISGARLQQELAQQKAIQRTKLARETRVAERVFTGTVALGILGGLRGAAGVVRLVQEPVQSVKAFVSALRQPLKTISVVGQQFTIDPVGTVTEFAVFSKTLNVAGKGVARSPVGRFVREEMYIRSMPKEIRTPVRSIIKSAKVQEKINPFKVKGIKRVDFAEIKTLTRTEAKAVAKTLSQTDSVIFGSAAARTLSRKRTPIPKDVDVATRNINIFNNVFIKNLPKKIRKGYSIRGQKLIRKSNGQALMDVKPLNRLIPDKSILTQRGFIPVSGFVKRLKVKKGSVLPQLKRKKVVGATVVPTQKLQKVGGIRLVGFGEQTTRKGLGTIQVLVEKNVRRAKDPQSFIISLKIQREAIKRTSPLTPVGRLKRSSRLKTLDSAIKILTSKKFADLLEKRIPGITKRFPILKKINTKRLKKIDLKKINKAVKRGVKKLPKGRLVLKKKVQPKRRPPKRPTPKPKAKKPIRRAIKRRVSKIPSKLKRKRPTPTKLPSKLPSKIPPTRIRRVPLSRPPSKAPSKVPSKVPSKPPSKPPSKIPPSRPPKKPPSRLPPSKPPSKLPSGLPPSRIGTKLPGRPRKRVIAKPPAKPFRRKKLKKVLRDISRQIQKRQFIFFPDLIAILFGEVAGRKQAKALLRRGRVFTGQEARRLIRLK